MPSDSARSAARRTPHATGHPGWSLTGSVASLTDAADATVARVDLGQPGAGIMIVPAALSGHRPTPSPAADPAGDHVLGLDLHGPARLVDHWIRGGDLAATYEPGDGRSLRATAMWRSPGAEVDATAGLRSWEVIVSAQTALLHADAGLAVACDLRAAQVAWGTLAAAGPAERVAWSATAHERWAPHARAVLVRRAAAPAATATSVLVAVHANDGLGIAAWLAGGRARVECRLFNAALEKGVLLRSRVLAVIGPAANDTSWADRVVRAYLALPPMLDT
jgi:hypothetical protein